MKNKTLLLGFLTLAMSCAAEDFPQDEQLTPEATNFDATADGDDGEDVEKAVLPERTAEFTEDSPCGNQTIDVLTVAPNHTVAFCGQLDGPSVVIEAAPLGHPAVVPQTVQCAAYVYAQLAPTRKVPSELLAQCAEDELQQRAAPIALEDLPQDGAVDVDAYSHYCGSGGDTEFADERCYDSASYGTQKLDICRSASTTWHQRTCKPTMGDWCRAAEQTIASCNGSTRFLVREKKRFRNSFNTFYDFDISNGYWNKKTIVAGKKGGLLFGWYDWDFRMNGDAYSNAYYRYAVSFAEN